MWWVLCIYWMDKNSSTFSVRFFVGDEILTYTIGLVNSFLALWVFESSADWNKERWTLRETKHLLLLLGNPPGGWVGCSTCTDYRLLCWLVRGSGSWDSRKSAGILGEGWRSPEAMGLEADSPDLLFGTERSSLCHFIPWTFCELSCSDSVMPMGSCNFCFDETVQLRNCVQMLMILPAPIVCRRLVPWRQVHPGLLFLAWF